jgi:hypothetical protein
MQSFAVDHEILCTFQFWVNRQNLDFDETSPQKVPEFFPFYSPWRQYNCRL